MTAVMNEETEKIWETEKKKMTKTVEVMKKKYGRKIVENVSDVRGNKVCNDLTKEEDEKGKIEEKVVTEGIETKDDKMPS
jgi:hypothetical protein